jgi:hypothetical protein
VWILYGFFFGWGSHAGSMLVRVSFLFEESVRCVAGDSEVGAAAGGCSCAASVLYNDSVVLNVQQNSLA